MKDNKNINKSEKRSKYLKKENYDKLLKELRTYIHENQYNERWGWDYICPCSDEDPFKWLDIDDLYELGLGLG